jgi:hypothetical protein
MAKTGRNQPCPCGSGKKSKMCCLGAQEAAEKAARLAAQEQQRQSKRQLFQAMRTVAVDAANAYEELDRLTYLSNGVLDLIRDGHLDEAERVCQQLLTEYPDVIDGHMRLGHLHRVRGDAKKAAEHIRIAATMARTPDYEPTVASGLDAEADQLDPPTT